MNRAYFYQQIAEIARLAPEERRAGLIEFHHSALPGYLFRLETLTESDACRTSTDGRSVAQVVHHIAAWERYTLQAAGEILSGVTWPRIMELKGYIETNGYLMNFNSVGDFNSYQVNRMDGWSWEQVRALAKDTAQAVHDVFTAPTVLTTERLEKTLQYEWSLPDGEILPMTAGWYLWLVSLEHALVEHDMDLRAANLPKTADFGLTPK
jgi:hypothetical protein